MSSSINIQVPQVGNPNSTEDPKIASNFTALAAWFANAQLGTNINDIANNAITTAKIADSTGASDGVTTSKLATSAVTTAKIADANVTVDKLATSAVATAKVAPVAVSRSKIRVFTVPARVTSLPSTISATGGTIATVGQTTITGLTCSVAPQVGQLVTVTTGAAYSYIPTDTVITAVTNTSGSIYDITLNNATLQTGSGLAVTIAPQDADEVYYVADNTQGNLWHLRYNASSSSAYKWEFVGGTPLRVVNSFTATTLNTNWTTNIFPTNTSTALPLGGDYSVELNAVINPTTNGGIAAVLTPTTLSSAITGTATGTFNVVNGTVLSDISEAYVVDATGTASEWVTATYASSTSITVSARGQRGTTAATHSTGLPLLGYASTGAIIAPAANSTYATKSVIREGLASGAKLQVAVRSTGSTNCTFDTTVLARPIRVG